MSEKIYVPIPPPPTAAETDPRAKLTDAEQEMYTKVLEHFSEAAYKIEGIEKDGELMEAEQFWLSNECIIRYLRASKWNVVIAIRRLEQTLKWRREFGLYDLLTAEHVEPEAVTGKEILFGYDTRSRPAFYMFPSRQNTDDATRQVQFVVWMLERSIDLMEPGIETIDLLINYADKAKNPSLSTARTVLSILQDHYPERLGLSIILNLPFLLNAFYKLITPLIDPLTREKMKFNPQVVKDKIFTPDMLIAEWWGGDRDFEYVHEKYWPRLVDMCETRRNAWMKKWRALGAKVGVKEWDYKGDAVVSEKEVEIPCDGPGKAEDGEVITTEYETQEKGSG